MVVFTRPCRLLSFSVKMYTQTWMTLVPECVKSSTTRHCFLICPQFLLRLTVSFLPYNHVPSVHVRLLVARHGPVLDQRDIRCWSLYHMKREVRLARFSTPDRKSVGRIHLHSINNRDGSLSPRNLRWNNVLIPFHLYIYIYINIYMVWTYLVHKSREAAAINWPTQLHQRCWYIEQSLARNTYYKINLLHWGLAHGGMVLIGTRQSPF